ncbi:MAG: ferritin family protein [Candidatus Bipolaricaulia bacterium]
MSFGFNADEILQMAERIERNGTRFYRAAVEATEDETFKSRFAELAEMEVSHEQTFAALRRELSSGEKEQTAFDPADETQAYLAAMADSEIFDTSKDPAELVSQAKSPAEVLRVAIGMEKESILLYLGLRDLVSERLGRDRVEEIIDEERSHVALLCGQLKALE